MKAIEQYQKTINEFISANKFSKFPQELYEPLDYIMALGGKRMRPVMVMMACDLMNGKMEDAVHAAMAIETFHNFTLIHDDIMDNAPVRRGKITVHEKWNVNTAILSGDVMLIEAYALLMKYENDLLRSILNIFNKSAIEVCEGQQIDMNFESRVDVSLSEYIHMITLKTAVVLGASLEVGALIAGVSKKQAQHLYEFGKNMGIAFQLRDDYLDLYADPEKFGKQVGGDVIANKKTFMLIKALELAKDNDAIELNKWLQAATFNASDKVAGIKNIFDRLAIPQLLNDAVTHYADLAWKEFAQIEASLEKKEMMADFMNGLLAREV
jgi:geranylgeranyl diphosphate synthase type II